MTSWQDPPRTRREARERERLLAEQQSPQAEPQQPLPTTMTGSISTAQHSRRAAVTGPIHGGDIPEFVPEETPSTPTATDAEVTRRGRRALHPGGEPVKTPESERPERVAQPHQAATSTLADEPGISNPPIAHWGSQKDTETSYPVSEQLGPRRRSSSGPPTTTNALILPALPEQSARSPIAHTGEVLVTGSIDMPRSYGATGVHPDRIESRDLDRSLDQVEDAQHSDAAPVSATRAVGTQVSARDVIAPPPKERAGLPVVLAIIAGVLALGAVGTLIAGYVLRIF